MMKELNNKFCIFLCSLCALCGEKKYTFLKPLKPNVVKQNI
jgi:hypothetical protein